MNIWNNSEAARRRAAVTLKYEDWAVCSAGIPASPRLSGDIAEMEPRIDGGWREQAKQSG